MANNVLQYRVNGAAAISAGVGSAGALVQVGYTESGALITPLIKSRPIYSDLGGPDVPVDFQHMGEMVVVDIDMPVWREDYLRTLIGRAFKADGTTRQTAGLAASRGQLWGLAGLFFTLAISSEYEDPHYFPTVMHGEPFGLNLGSIHSKYRMRFTAWPYLVGSSTTAIDKTCWLRAIP